VGCPGLTYVSDGVEAAAERRYKRTQGRTVIGGTPGRTRPFDPVRPIPETS